MYLCVGKRRAFLDKGLNTELLQTWTAMTLSLLSLVMAARVLWWWDMVVCWEARSIFCSGRMLENKNVLFHLFVNTRVGRTAFCISHLSLSSLLTFILSVIFYSVTLGNQICWHFTLSMEKSCTGPPYTTGSVCSIVKSGKWEARENICNKRYLHARVELNSGKGQAQAFPFPRAWPHLIW